MRPSLLTSTPLLVATSIFAAMAQSQDSTNAWDNVSRLPHGSEVRATLTTGGTLRGILRNTSADSLVIDSTTGQQTLSRQDVRRVQVKRPGHRKRNALIGLAVGAGGGLAAGAAADASSSPSLFPNAGKEAFTGLGAIVGTVVGLVIPTGGWRESYRAP